MLSDEEKKVEGDIKMNSIDILEKMKIVNGKIENVTPIDAIFAISTLIAENKELKGKNKGLKEFKENIEKIDRKQLDKLYEDAQKALKEYRETQNKVAKLEEENKELKEKVKAYETECRRFKAFCKKIRKDEKHDVDLFNQGQEQKCNEFLNLIEGEQHWNYEGKYFDETDKQIEDMKQSLLGKE